MAMFSGRVNVTTTSATEGEFRINNLFEMPMAAITLGTKVIANHVMPVPPDGLGFSIGEVAGVAGSFLKGAPPTTVAGRVFTFTVDGKNSDSTFAGIVTDQAVTGSAPIANPTAIRKTGTGTWTLSGANTHSGSTTVAAGTLKIAASGTIANSATTEVLSGGTLEMAGGSLATGPVTISAGGTLKGFGTIKGQVTNNGMIMNDSLLQPVHATLTNGVFTARILSQNGFSYQLQHRTDLVDGNWQDVGIPVSGNGAVISLSQPMLAEADKRFYRIAIAP